MSDWIRRSYADSEGWHQPSPRSNVHGPLLVVALCGAAWGADETEWGLGTMPRREDRCPACVVMIALDAREVAARRA